MQKERNIVEGKYPKNCWNKIILMLGINLLFVMCVHKTSERYEDMFVDSTWQSPFVAMSQSFMKQAQQIWAQIYQIVKENCSEEVTLTGEMDMMEQLLRSRK